MLAEEIEEVARSIYETHLAVPDWDSGRRASPTWDNASEAVRDWVCAQSLSAINALREIGWRRSVDRQPASGIERPARAPGQVGL